MMKSFCQFILLSFVTSVLLTACSTYPDKYVYKAQPQWFSLRKSIGLSRWDGVLEPHLFYDTIPGLDPALSHVNFLPLSLANEEKAYGFDVLSGQRFFSHFFCGQKDAWKKRGTTPRTPTFSRGIVPRHFDQLHEPQQIIVFGQTRRFKLNKPEVYRVRVVGGVVEQLCKAGRCTGPGEWISRLVLVAVNEYDRDFKDIKNIRELREEISWRDVQNELENHEGHNYYGGLGEVPAIKVGNLLENREVMEYMLDRSVILNSKELSDLNHQCGRLYWRLWRDVGRFTTADSYLQRKEDIRAKLALREKLRKANKRASFHGLLSGFFEREGDQLATCARMVYPADSGKDFERFWFTSWVAQFVRLHKEGWVFACGSQTWESENQGDKAMQYLKTRSGSCSDRAFDRAMETMPAFLRNQREKSGDLWGFIEWDNGIYGTHNKLYSWVKVPNRRMTCPDTENEKWRGRWQEGPDNLSWLRRYRRSNSDKNEYIY